MLKLRAFRPTNEKIKKIHVHPTQPWLVTADVSDHVSVWNWEYRQVIYELKAGGVDERRLVGAKLEKLAEGESEHRGKPTEAIRAGSVKQVKFYDDDVRYWQLLRNRSAAAEAPTATSNVTSAFSAPSPSAKGRHFLVICCENKAIFLDLVTMRGRDVPKQDLDNKSLICMEFLCRSNGGDGPLVAFGSSDGAIRVLSMITWKLARRYTGGHKGAISCLMTFLSASGEGLLVSGGSDGLLIIWNADHAHHHRELVPKLSLKAHDGGVIAVELSRVIGRTPWLITIGADKTLAIWDTVSLKELRRIKPVSKLACNSVQSWCHPRAPNLDILICVKDSHIWAIEHPTHSALTRPLCELSSLVALQLLPSQKKLKVYCMVTHPLQPHLVATGTNVGIILCEFNALALPSVAPLPTPIGGHEHTAIYVVQRELKLLRFQLSNTANPAIGNNGISSNTAPEQLLVKQTKKHITTPVPHDSYSVLSVSSSVILLYKSCRYLAIVWPDIPYFTIYKVSGWSIVDSGSARLLVWDTCRDRFALLESAVFPRMPIIPKAASSAAVQVRILLDDGTSNVLMRSVGSRSEPVIGLHGGALLGVAYRTSWRVRSISTMPLSGYGASSVSSFSAFESSIASQKASAQNFQLYSWETFQPVGAALPQPEWTAWDQTVEYCAFAYPEYIVIASLRPQFRYLGDVAIPYATGAVWQRRQLFVATPTTIECIFVDAGVASVDIETKRRKEEMRLKEAQARAVAEHGELALITIDSQQNAPQERIKLRPPMLQVVRLASFQHEHYMPPFLTLPKLSKAETDETWMPKEMEERRVSEVAIGGGGIAVAVTRFPAEQRRPVGPLLIVGVRDGVLWLVDRYICAHAISLSHPGIRCRCLAAYGDAVSAVKWASRLGREHHDDLAQFMLGMGYAMEALHLPGISKRLEFDLAMQSNDLRRALQCLLTMSNSRDIGHEALSLDLNDIMNLAEKKENVVEAVQGVVKFAKEFMNLIDAADATGQVDVAREALKRLAAAGSVKGALQGQELNGVALRLANHGELARLSNMVNNLIPVGSGREAAFAAALLGDNLLMEKAWQETGMLAEAVLHAHAHGRPSLRTLVQAWNKTLQKEMEHTPSTKTDATSAFLASLEEPKLTSLIDAAKKHPIEILPPGMASLYGPNPGQTKAPPGKQGMLQQLGKQIIEGSKTSQPNATSSAENGTATVSESGIPSKSEVAPSVTPEPDTPAVSASTAPPAEPDAAQAQPSAPQPSDLGAEVSPEPSTPDLAQPKNKTSDNQVTVSSLVGASDPTLTGEGIPSTSKDISSAAENEHQLPDNMGNAVPNELPMIEFS
nr:G-protein beta subunit-like protein (contains WD40 repeats) [Ipomoea batatas]